MIDPGPGGKGGGVRAHEGASTPFPLPGAGSADALATLEFAAALRLVAAHAAGPLGQARILARQPSGEAGWIHEELAAVGEVLALLRRGDALVALPVPEVAGALARLRLEGTVLETSELLALRQTLTAARAVAADLRRVAEAAPRAGALRADLPDRAVERRLAESVDEETGELLDTASPALAAVRREVQSARDRLVRKLEALLRGLDPQAVPAGATVTMRQGRYVIPVRRDSRSRPEGIVHDESGSAGTLFLEPSAAIELGNALRGAIADEQRETLRVLRELTSLLRPARAELQAAHAMCVAVDDLVARARYALAVAGELPEVVGAGDGMRLRGARHPLLLARLPEVVPFDLELTDGARTLLVSGPNTGGKTVLLKTVGLVASLVQSGVVPPIGAGSRLPVFRQFFADIGDHQSIAADLSTFSAHLALLRQVLEAADASTLVLLDEVGSGTDPAEGAALAAAALRHLTARGALTLATTHLGALKTLASRTARVVNGSLHFDTASLSPTFRFQLGVPGRSYGLAIARRLGIDTGVLADAEAEVPGAERALENLLASVEERDRDLRERLAGVEEREVEASALQARIDGQAAQLMAREEALAERERSAERRAREEARRFLLEARARVEQALQVAGSAAEEAAAREARRLVEEGVEAERAALESLEAEPEAASLAAAEGALVGRRVRTATGATGEVVEQRGDGRLVVRAGAMRLVVPAETVQVLAGSAARPREAAVARPAGGGVAAAAPLEIDLRGMRADEAESVTLAALDAAVLAEHPHLRIIHGMGTGAVRDRVQRVLRADRRVSRFEFAPRNQGGTGVTIVEFTAG